MIEEPPILTIVKNRPRPTQAQIDAFRGVPTGFVCDAMDGMGALETAIAPVGGRVDPQMHAAGPALVAENGPAEILATLAAATLAQPGDVIVSSVSGWQGCSAAGDQVLGMMKNAGAAGFVTDGPMRDFEGILQVRLPAWCTGLNPNSPYGNGPGRVGGSAVIGGVTVATGDLIVADCNGVVVVPFARIDAVIATLAKVRALEADLETKVGDGFRSPLDLDEMLAAGRAVEID
ncbi:RraA family protein [Marimonas lutisalis]|uniref:RraA family protein n=1 Tax=Marimonas lutisalis TaxID=2545756 RepID=UPI0010F88AC7|nr:RraA family protein [Marimonas lutisalis]